MSISIRSPRDFYAGLIFLLFGALAAYIARDYPIGSAVRMGPGYFPYLLGILLGPQMMTERPELFWGMIASMWIGNLLLVVLNLPLIGIWIKLLSVPYRILYPAILLFSCIGVYSLNNSAVDVALALAFGFLGYVFIKLDCEPAPLLLGFVLGPMMEENLRRTLLLF